METHLQREDNVNIKGYITKVRRDRDSQGGGVMIAIKGKYSHVYAEVVEVENKEKELEQIWIDMGSKTKYRIGLVYAAQGDKQKVKEIEQNMKRIEKEIRKGKEDGRKVFVMGDFNAKVDREEDEGKIKSKGGKKLKEVAKANGMIFINEMKVTEGKRTRVENGKK